MLIFNHSLIPKNIKFCEISSIQDIEKTSANSVVYFEFNNIDIINFCNENSVKFALLVNNKKEAVFANTLMASYTFSNKHICKEIQKVAECYMFDSKNILVCKNEEDIDFAIDNEIDGVIFL